MREPLTKEPLVTAVIPTHNRANMLARAIRSVQGQTYRHLEIIVIDDASTDNTREVVEDIGDPRIRYIRRDTNGGGAVARNVGIRAAIGAYIAFLDDDDEWEPEKTEEQLKAIQECDGCDAITCASYPIEEKSSRKLALSTRVALDDLLEGKFMWGGTGVLMARAHVLKQTMFDENLPRFQDWDLFIRIALSHKIAYINRPLMRSGAGPHARITNSVLSVPLAELEQHYRMLHKNKSLFGQSRFERHMSEALLFGLKHRQDKLALLAYTTRHYGIVNVARALAARVRAKVRERLLHTTPTAQSAVGRSETL